MNLPLTAGLEEVDNKSDKHRLDEDQLGIECLPYRIFVQKDELSTTLVVDESSIHSAAALTHSVTATRVNTPFVVLTQGNYQAINKPLSSRQTFPMS